jgi:hypothetical protein
VSEQLETHAITAWDPLDTDAADAATSTAITTAGAKNLMLCLALGQTQIRGPESAPGTKATPVTNGSAYLT